MEKSRQKVTETIVPDVKLEPGSSNTTPKTATTLANLIGNVSLPPFLLRQFPASQNSSLKPYDIGCIIFFNVDI